MNRKQKFIASVATVILCIDAHSTLVTAPNTYKELLKAPEDSLRHVDIARMNLLCAEGLPGAENLNIERYLRKLDAWAKYVVTVEQQYMPAFHRNKDKYRNSQALFKGVYLGIAIEQDFGCGYNQELLDSGAMNERQSTRFYKDASDIFIHGLLDDGKGSCSSLPVLMVALGRRCDYPIHLVGCGGHVFARWDDGSEKLNFEITCNGVNSYDDEHYKQWPRPISDKEMEAESLLQNYSAKQMLGIFVALRANCLKEHGYYAEALECYKVALRYFPKSKRFQLCIEDMDQKLRDGKCD